MNADKKLLSSFILSLFVQDLCRVKLRGRLGLCTDELVHGSAILGQFDSALLESTCSSSFCCCQCVSRAVLCQTAWQSLGLHQILPDCEGSDAEGGILRRDNSFNITEVVPQPRQDLKYDNQIAKQLQNTINCSIAQSRLQSRHFAKKASHSLPSTALSELSFLAAFRKAAKTQA